MSGERRISETELHAFVDGELSRAERAEVEAALAAAPADAAEVRGLLDLNAALKDRYADELGKPLPADLLKAFGRASPGRTLVSRLLPVAAAIGLACLGAAGGYVARDLLGEASGPQAGFVANAIGAHAVYMSEVRHPVEVGAAEEAHLVQWLTKRVGANVRAPTLAALGWKLIGGRLLPDQGLPAAQFMYEDAGGRRITLYIRKETGLNNTSFRFAERDGLTAFYWIDRPLAYAIAGRLSRDELTKLADAVYAQLDQLGPTAPTKG